MMRRLVTAVLGVLLLGGCGWAGTVAGDNPDYNVPLTPAQVVGVWSNKEFGGAITFAADGTFTATDLPYEAYVENSQSTPPGFDGPHAHLNDRGSWKLEPETPGEAGSRLTSVRIDSDGNPTFPRGFNAVLRSWRQPDGAGSLLLEVANAPRFKDIYVYLRAAPAASPAPSRSR
jgi:hypothetical protein